MKKISRRSFLKVSAAGMVAAGLAACGSTGTSTASSAAASAASSAAGSTASAGGKITVFEQKAEIYDKLVELAKSYESETGVSVEVWPISGDDFYQNLKTYMSSESGPTVFTLNSQSEIDEMSGYLADLSDLAVIPKVQDTTLIGKSGDTTIGVPMTAEGFGVVYNKSLYDPTKLNTADALCDFIAQSGDVTAFQLSQESYFLNGHILNFPFALQKDPKAFCKQVYGGEVNLADVEEFKQYAKIFGAIRDHEKNPVEVTYDGNCGDFATGKTAAIHQGNWCYSMFADYTVDFDMAMTGLPIDGNSAIPVGVPSYWCVNADASDADQKLGKDFIDWMYTSETGLGYLSDFGFLPIVDGMKSDNLDPLSAAIGDAIAANNILPWTFNTEWPANIIDNYLAPLAQKFFTDTSMTEEDYLKQLTDAFVTAAKE